jgi:iron(III) transport system substrate-binding protein
MAPRSIPAPISWLARLAVALLAALAVPASAPAGPAEREVVVYSARHYGNEPAFDAFTRQTGIAIKTFSGSSAELFERLRAEGDRTPADLLVTVDAGNLWNAARAGLLAAVDSAVLRANVPAHLRDPEQRWFGLTVRARTIMYNTRKVKPADLSTYEALADARWKGRLCLRPSNYIYSQSFLAALIKRHGEPRAEEMVRGWVANQPVLINSDTKLLEAVAAGQCDVTLANHYYLARLVTKDPTFPVAPFWANQKATGTHVNVSGAGVTAHARHREGAIRLLEFLSSTEAQNLFADGNFEYPANPRVRPVPLLAQWGEFRADDLPIAATGELQAAATRLADRAGYK